MDSGQVAVAVDAYYGNLDVQRLFSTVLEDLKAKQPELVEGRDVATLATTTGGSIPCSLLRVPRASLVTRMPMG